MSLDGDTGKGGDYKLSADVFDDVGIVRDQNDYTEFTGQELSQQYTDELFGDIPLGDKSDGEGESSDVSVAKTDKETVESDGSDANSSPGQESSESQVTAVKSETSEASDTKTIEKAPESIDDASKVASTEGLSIPDTVQNNPSTRNSMLQLEERMYAISSAMKAGSELT